MKNTALHVIVTAMFVAFVGTALADTAPAGGGGGGGGADVYMQVRVPDPKDPKIHIEPLDAE